MPPIGSLVKALSPQTQAFFITCVDNYKSYSDGTTGHALNDRFGSLAVIQSAGNLVSRMSAFGHKRTLKEKPRLDGRGFMGGYTTKDRKRLLLRIEYPVQHRTCRATTTEMIPAQTCSLNNLLTRAAPGVRGRKAVH